LNAFKWIYVIGYSTKQTGAERNSEKLSPETVVTLVDGLTIFTTFIRRKTSDVTEFNFVRFKLARI
jgi:hypothetical protein